MTSKELDEAKRFGRVELHGNLADRAVDVTYLAIMALCLARPVDQWLRGWEFLDTYASARMVAIYLITMGLHILVSLPLSYYFGYVTDRRFGMSDSSRAAWLWNYLKRNLLALCAGLAMFSGLYCLIWLIGPFWWIASAAVFFLFTIALGQLAPVWILPMFYKVERLEAGEITDRLVDLAEPAGLSIEGIYRMDMTAETNEANAVLAGLGKTRRVLLGSKILEEFSSDEITVIFGHEIGHHVYRHIHKILFAGGLFSLAAFWICDALMMEYAAAYEPDLSYAEFPVWTLPLLMLTITVFMQLLEPLRNIISRRYERQCDRYALERTGMKEAYKSAFWKLARLNKDDPDPHPLEVFFLHSHPPISERLAMADEY